MITVRPSAERGRADFGWLKSFHTFSFGDYIDPAHTHYQTLRVINEDWVAGGQGFPRHPHRDMEIFTYVVEGALEHQDSLGTNGVIQTHEMQVMSAGTGITHSEFNHSKSEPVHLLQIWLFPEAKNLAPRYAQKAFSPAEKANVLRPILSHDERGGSLKLFQDVVVYATILEPEHKLIHQPAPERFGWVQLIEGELALEDVQGVVTTLKTGDAAAFTGKASLCLTASEKAHFLTFDLK